MNGFKPFVDHLHALTRSFDGSCNAGWHNSVDLALDGQASKQLRQHVNIAKLREVGAFFTSTSLAKKLLEKSSQNEIFLDPACGAGNLLITAARLLPLDSTLSKTLKLWGGQLAGFDLHQDFIRATKLRLLLLALARLSFSRRPALPEIDSLFPNIKCADALKEAHAYGDSDRILLNPPYTMIETSDDIPWASGKVSAAAVFLLHCLEQMQEGAYIDAVLPDVLRTGSRYSYWREEIRHRATLLHIGRYGIFDSKTDVDVFVLRLRKRRSRRAPILHREKWTGLSPSAGDTLGMHFNVSVGAVVPFRHKKRGCLRAYVCPVGAIPWATMSRLRTHRRFEGTVHKPPFVVIRRTSRPGDTHRAVGTIIDGKRPVAVENHLIVCTPKRGGIRMCERLLELLKQEQVTRWLDRRICCRHLTVAAVESIPWKS